MSDERDSLDRRSESILFYDVFDDRPAHTSIRSDSVLLRPLVRLLLATSSTYDGESMLEKVKRYLSSDESSGSSDEYEGRGV